MTRRFSQAISEGDGISLIAEVDTPDAARAAEREGAEALLVYSGHERILRELREATTLPVLFFFDGEQADALEGADACVIEARAGDEGWLEHVRTELGDRYELVLRVEDEDSLVTALDRLDPEILLLSGPRARERRQVEYVLGLLPDVPAGKLAIADVGGTTRDDVSELERAGVDGVIVEAADVSHLVGDQRPEV